MAPTRYQLIIAPQLFIFGPELIDHLLFSLSLALTPSLSLSLSATCRFLTTRHFNVITILSGAEFSTPTVAHLWHWSLSQRAPCSALCVGFRTPNYAQDVVKQALAIYECCRQKAHSLGSRQTGSDINGRCKAAFALYILILSTHVCQDHIYKKKTQYRLIHNYKILYFLTWNY